MIAEHESEDQFNSPLYWHFVVDDGFRENVDR